MRFPQCDDEIISRVHPLWLATTFHFHMDSNLILNAYSLNHHLKFVNGVELSHDGFYRARVQFVPRINLMSSQRPRNPPS